MLGCPGKSKAIIAAVVGVACLIALPVGCKKGDSKHGSAAQLRQVRLRHSQDAAGVTCYIVAEVENVGETPVKEAVATAVLHNRRGKEVGTNNFPLNDIQPGEVRLFSMTVSAHADFRTVELAFEDPGSPETD